MKKEENRTFIRKVESLVKPKDITAISFLGDFNRLLPKKTQHMLMEKGKGKVPYMGFIVDPYCFFLSYRIKDAEAASAMLPEGYELADSSMFKDGPKHPLVVISAFSVRTSAFIGFRLEFYIIARHRDTGMVSWIIADYETNTNSHDPKNGFCGYTSDPSVFTTTPYGELLVDFKNPAKGTEFALKTDLSKGKIRSLEEDLWIEGNMSVDYGGALKDDSSRPFSLIFDPVLMNEALDIPLEYVDIEVNSYLPDIIEFENPVSAAVFPYSQHFIIRQDLDPHGIRDVSGLNNQVDAFLGGTGFKTMSGDDIKKPLLRGMIISALINYGLIIFLLIRLLS